MNRSRRGTASGANLMALGYDFRGLFTLFWIMIFLGAVRTGVRHYNEQGVVWGRGFATMISEDAKMLALSDAVMVTSTFLCVPFVKMLNKGWIRYYWTGAILQHALQTLFLGLAIRWTFHRQWPWVQSGFMTLHTLSMLMKVHSYCSHNGELSDKSHQLRTDSIKLDGLIEKAGGRAEVEKAARAAWEVQVAAAASSSGMEETTSVDSVVTEKGLPTLEAFGDDKLGIPNAEPSMDEGRHPSVSGLVRRRSRARKAPDAPIEEGKEVTKESTPRAKDVPTAGIEVLTWHPDPAISALAIVLADLKDDLVSTGVGKVVYPSNVGYWNFLDYLLVPTLVYQLEYARTTKRVPFFLCGRVTMLTERDRIRPMFIAEKALATLGTFTLIILIVEHYILPVSANVHETTFFITVLDLAMPFTINYLLIFYIIFECICNLFAEITRFADREFYQDWWNSTSFDEFSRRWNIPVHTFLLRHVYTSTITTYKFSKFQAAFVTFLLSAAVHELVMAIVTKKIRMYLFAMQMAQLPLIMFGRLPFFKRYPALGNLFFWVGLLSGFPLLAVTYIRF